MSFSARCVPRPRPPGDGGPARWYEERLGWATVAGPPVGLLTGLRFDVLELPAAAGRAVLRRAGAGGTGPVALVGRRMRLLVAAGSAEELPGLLDWLEWGGISLDLSALGAGSRMAAPVPPGWSGSGAPGAAVWLRAPEPGRAVEPSLPALWTAARGGAAAPCLVRLVAAAAAECHRVRLLSACPLDGLPGRPVGRPVERSVRPVPQQLTPQRFASS
ncbi:SCO3374 family protein [Streptomyces sp. Je 1-79]|uniref:SCO3374 family protein n=1 Tax=Streptomyces sp. Je 1-79 TaxID=2943847 RepID=UPI0021A3D8D4|nr:SCO3374 family protein [Streptomyces sp. Je 1-79]MCT4354511.1 SCO3374 family protein [Streptomyces sp. Je 1-79]